MGLVSWIQHNGVEAMILYYALIALVGSMPQIPADAGFWSKWAYGFLHMFAGNLRALKDMVQSGTGKVIPELNSSPDPKP